ncbi:anti-sigma factor [Kocuria flava]|uniref:anti-sigma factor n=1 Tax=Kocuria flava TaxID=446860 RepID=UPI002F94329A
MTESTHGAHGGAPGTVHDDAALYAVDALEPAERAAFEQHLARCAACRREVAELAEVGAGLAAALAQEPPAELRDGVLAGLRGTAQDPPPGRRAGGVGGPASEDLADRRAAEGTDPRDRTGGEPGRSRSGGGSAAPVADLDGRRRRVRRALAAAAAAVLVPGLVLGGWVLGAQGERQEQERLTARQQDELAREQRLLAAPDVVTRRLEIDGRGTATLVVSASRDEAMVVSTDLSDPGAGKEYQLWLMEDEVPVPDVRLGGGAVRTWLDGDVSAAEAVAVTIEPAGGSRTPTLPVLGVAEV